MGLGGSIRVGMVLGRLVGLVLDLRLRWVRFQKVI